jgi:two-component system sensor histidine kinase KdpD
MDTDPLRRSAAFWRAMEKQTIWAAAILGPAVVTAALLGYSHQTQRDYVFIYLGLVAVVGVFRGLWPALLCAALSFLMVDYFFVPPVDTFTIADEQDIVNLLAFLVIGGLVGYLASRRRRALLESQALTRQLRDVNTELVRLNQEQATAAQAALRLARSEQQIRALQESDRLRSELLANVSHELRTPLGTILTESTDPSGVKTVEDAMRKLGTVATEARRLEALVTDMLDMARIEGGALDLDLEPVRAGDAISAAVERLHHVSPEREVTWDGDSADVEVLADWARLGQIFDNLLANANRFAPAASPINVEVSTGTQLVAIKVIDHGPGIPAELRPHLFQRFVRGDSKENEATGTGLGLAIVKGLVEAHAGTVTLEESPDGVGAIFRFTLPLAPATQA